MASRALLVTGALLLGLARAQTAPAFQEISDSHVRGNVPPGASFDRLLRRDLTTYFRESTGKKTTVAYELLRNGPTQSGVAYPKYYLWATARVGKKTVIEGAARVAAIGQERFDVTDFLSQAELKKDPTTMESVFPRAVCDKIRQRLLSKGKH
jgi:uncharacterized protein YaiE (UPF0345 family)